MLNTERVCLYVCSHILKTTRPNFAKFSVHVDCGHGSVLVVGCAYRGRSLLSTIALLLLLHPVPFPLPLLPRYARILMPPM